MARVCHPMRRLSPFRGDPTHGPLPRFRGPAALTFAACPEGHDLIDHPLIYSQMVLTLIMWANTDPPCRAISTALAAWWPHRVGPPALSMVTDPHIQITYQPWTRAIAHDKLSGPWSTLARISLGMNVRDRLVATHPSTADE